MPHKSKSRSRERDRDRERPESPMFESPDPRADRLRVTSTTAGSSGFWSGESLPPNASSNFPGSASASAFSAFAPGSDGSHFFFPHGAGFSFEGEGSSGGSAMGGQPFFLRDRKFLGTDSLQEESVASSWGSSMAGGGRRYRRPSRSMRYSLSGTVGADRGLVALTKPKEQGDGRVAVVGKSYFKLLKIPSPLRPAEIDSAASIASRRSRSRGSPVPMDRTSSYTADSDRERDRDGITELADMKSGSRLSPTYLFTDVQWGYADTANKIATSFSNGAVALWDSQREGSNRLDQVMQQHDRAVNQVVFGGPGGNYLLSAGQDGQIKIWDIRQGRSSNNKLKASSPVQRIKFSPSASQPWTLLAVCSSGTLIRYDLRNFSSGKPGGGMTDRVAGHVGACLGMDWRDNYESDGERREGGWVATAGMDRTIKIWDFSLPILSTRPVRTLYPFQPVQHVAWHPTIGTELASSPVPSLGIAHSSDDNLASGFSLNMDPGKSSTFWKNEIEIWDTRRPSFPKCAIKTEDSVAAFMYNDDASIWCASKSVGVFQQHDLKTDTYALLDNVPRPSAKWNAEGELLFSNGTKATGSMLWGKPTTASAEDRAVDGPKFLPDTTLSSIAAFDPDFSATTFSELANTVVLTGKSFGEMCDINAEAYEYVDRPDASQLWSTLKVWFDDAPILLPDSPPKTPPKEEIADSSASERLSEWLRSPNAVVDTNPRTRASRRSFSLTLSRTRSITNSPVILPADAPGGPLDAFSEESTASESDVPPAIAALLSPGVTSAEGGQSSDSDLERATRLRNLAVANGSSAKFAISGAALQHSRSKPSTLANLTSLSNSTDDDPSLDLNADEDDTALVADATELVKAQVRTTLQEYADRGDSQLCASVCIALRDKDIGFSPSFVARVTKAYLDVLRSLKLYVPAAAVIKYSPTESIRAQSQNTVVYHTACGKCGKVLSRRLTDSVLAAPTKLRDAASVTSSPIRSSCFAAPAGT
ncbi:WD repeat protein 24 [Pseudohyphozyma bogoriensis]|nr:WD repeat protein 24 [Pseudohyphozyma bogoriensis]